MRSLPPLSLTGRVALLLFRILGLLPMPVLMLFGTLAGSAARHILRGRNKVCMRNLQLCFPDKTDEEVRRLARKCFRATGRAVIGHFAVLASSRGRIRRLVSVEGTKNLAGREGHPTILYCPHFVGAIVFNAWLSIDYRSGLLLAQQHGAVSAEVLARVLQRFGGETFHRKRDLFSAVRWLKSGKVLSYSPDADMNAEGGVVFVPFFAVDETATTTAMSRMAELTHAKVLPVRVELSVSGKYRAVIYPPWGEYPSGDGAKDAERMNRVLEEMILEAPEQYYWLHRRFKTRPEGKSSLY